MLSNLANNYFILTTAAFFLALSITFVAIPAVIKVAELKHLFDEPDHRKTHKVKTPTLGGVAIFAGLVISFSILKDFKELLDIKFLVPSLIIIFFAGIKDDILVLTPLKKFLAQLAAAVLMVCLGDIRITSFYGLLGVQEIPYIFSIVFTVLAIIAVINCYNLIDGADGLAGSLGLLSSVVFGLWFFYVEQWSLAFLAFALAGSLVGFLYFNWQPAQIFMGDTGAMVLGFILSVLAIRFIELNKARHSFESYWVHASPSVAMSVMSIPIFDMLKVFTIRLLKKSSPFKADRNHLHHILMDLGFSHKKLAILLFIWNLVIACLAFYFKAAKSSTMLVYLVVLVMGPSLWLLYLRNKKQAQTKL